MRECLECSADATVEVPIVLRSGRTVIVVLCVAHAREFARADSGIRIARLAAGLTQAQLADRIGVTRAALARWESGEVSPSPLAREALARELALLARKE